METSLRKLLILSLSVCYVSASPILIPPPENPQFSFSIHKEFCFLPPEYGSKGGNVSLLEDCPYKRLKRFNTLPMIADQRRKQGVHPKVCCPEYLSPRSICTPSDAWCPTYVAEPPLTDTPGSQQGFLQTVPTMSERSCNPYGPYYFLPGLGNLTECVPLNRCGKVLDNAFAPNNQTQPCGFDEEEQMMMICCPPELVTEPIDYEIAPRFPGPDGRERPAEDKSELCGRWKENGGCALDTDFVISKVDPWNGKMANSEFFSFMETACLASCGWADKKGCVDEHPRCVEWTRAGMCNTNTIFMAHTCRESCGVCGFLSPFNTEDQVVDGGSYTEYKSDNFKCGEYELLCKINKEDCEGKRFHTPEDEVTVDDVEDNVSDVFDEDYPDLSDDFDIRNAAFSFNAEEADQYFCGSTVVSDRFVVAAAHCHDNFQNIATNQAQQIRTIKIRDYTAYTDQVEIKKVYKHPLYQYPNLYNDIAILELGRRIEYDFKTFGDSPTCIDQPGQNNVGKLATVQGYGITENGVTGTLLETNVTVITNQQCKEMFQFNQTLNKAIKRQIETALPNGLNYGFLCAQGTRNNKGIFRSSCKGDSGGPLLTQSHEDRQTLIGIVSGGIGCGKGIPGWYTKVSFYYPWIDCIIQTSKDNGGNTELVNEKCDEVARNLVPPCLQEDDLIFSEYDFDLRADEYFQIGRCNK